MARQSARSSSPVASGWRSYRRWLVLSALLVAGLVGLLMFQPPPWSNNAESAEAKPVPFDGKRAMGYLEAICKIGPRMSGTEGMTKQQELIEKHFKDLEAKVSYQRFTAKQKSVRKSVEMANMIISYHPDRARRVI